MPASGLLALLDDIASIADDVATLSAAAARKSTGIVTDDMAVTAEQAIGIRREREIPVVLAVAKGSLRNKALILAPAALALNAVAPWAILPLLMAGGSFLCFEGVEKVLHWGHVAEDVGDDLSTTDPEAYEKGRIAGAIRTDLILSAEIIAISLGEVKDSPFLSQAVVLYVISILMTIGVYGIVAGLIKLDDLGELLVRRGGSSKSSGELLLKGAPYLMRAISIIGTFAMLMVGGHILRDGIPPVHHFLEHALEHAPLAGLLSALADIGLGGVAGLVLVGVAVVVKRVRKK